MSDRVKSSYDLDAMKRMLLNREARYFTDPARDGAAELGYITDDEMVEFIQYVSHSEFYKTMPRNYPPGAMQDVYHTSDGHEEIYLKLGMNQSNTRVVISAFKKK